MAETDTRILELLEEGLFLYGVGKVQDSIGRWKKVLELDPRNERAMDYIESAGGDVSDYRARANGAAPSPAPPATTTPTPPPASPPLPTPSFATTMPSPPPPASPPPPSNTFTATAPSAPQPAWATTPPPSPPAPPPVAAAPPPPPAPAAAPTGESREELLAKAAALYRARYFEAALELLEKIAREHPPIDETIQGYMDSARTSFFETLRSQWSRMELVPRPRLGPGQLMQLKLSPEAGFVLSRIDGASSIEDLIAMSGLDEFTALRALNSLLQQGAIELAQG